MSYDVVTACRAVSALAFTFLVTACGSSSSSAKSTDKSTADSGSGAVSTCSGKPGALKGKTDHANFTVAADGGGTGRHFILYEPSSLDPNKPAPVVIVPHGYTMSAQSMVDITGYTTKADAEGFVVAFPTGETGDNSAALNGPWNVGKDACVSTLGLVPMGTENDQAFMDAIVDFVETDQCVDHDHVFMAGFSMGGYFSNETGCIRGSSKFRAIAPASGGTHDLSTCVAGHEPVILFHGTADTLIPETCGTQARDRWVAKNGCSTTTTSVEVMGGHCEYSQGCPADGQVALCLFDGMAHAWPGGEGTSFSDATKASATDLAWDFFKKYAW